MNQDAAARAVCGRRRSVRCLQEEGGAARWAEVAEGARRAGGSWRLDDLGAGVQ